MLETYLGILRDNHIEWCGEAPSQPTGTQGVPVQVTILPANDIEPSQGQRMAEILEKLAAVSTLKDMGDPALWERDVRQDRSLPDRES